MNWVACAEWPSGFEQDFAAKIFPKILAKERAAKFCSSHVLHWRRAEGASICSMDWPGLTGYAATGFSAFENPASKTLFFRYSLGSRM
jgi:hypothetical protein